MADTKKVARRFYEEVLNAGRVEVIDELFVPGYQENDPLPGQRTGIDGVRDRVTMVRTGLAPTFTLEDVIAEDDKVVVRWRNHGTHVAEFMGLPATGKSFSTTGIDIYRVENGKLAEHWHVVDVLSQLIQEGLITMPLGADA
jgi:steroid delta-isomerase-like uncharacterized protein